MRDKDRSKFQKWAISLLQKGGLLTFESLSFYEKQEMNKLQSCGVVVRNKEGYQLVSSLTKKPEWFTIYENKS